MGLKGKAGAGKGEEKGRSRAGVRTCRGDSVTPHEAAPKAAQGQKVLATARKPKPEMTEEEGKERGRGKWQVLPAEHSTRLPRLLAQGTTWIQKQNWRCIPANAERGEEQDTFQVNGGPPRPAPRAPGL